MKSILTALGLAIVAALGAPALAADLQAPADPPPTSSVADYLPMKALSGCYIGVHAGLGIMDAGVAVSGLSIDGLSGSGFAGGATAGCDAQITQRIFAGAWADYTRHTEDFKIGLGGTDVTVGPRDQWAVGGRVGVGLTADNSTRVYALAGYSQVSFSDLSGGGLSVGMPTFDGYVVGGGLETSLGMLPKGWSLDARYTWTHLSEKDVAGSGVMVQPDLHNVRAGLNYKF